VTHQRIDVDVRRTKRALRGRTTLTCAGADGAFAGARVRAEGLKIASCAINGARRARRSDDDDDDDERFERCKRCDATRCDAATRGGASGETDA